MIGRGWERGYEQGTTPLCVPDAKRVTRAHPHSAWCLEYGKLKSLSVFHSFVPLIMYID